MTRDEAMASSRTAAAARSRGDAARVVLRDARPADAPSVDATGVILRDARPADAPSVDSTGVILRDARPADAPSVDSTGVILRDARPADARAIADLVRPYALRRILISKELIAYFEDIQEFVVAEDTATGTVVGCGALHVLWDDIAEIRTLAVNPSYLHTGLGSRILRSLIARAEALGLQRVFCLTFEVDFFARHGFYEIEGTPVGQDAYAEMLLSHDDGVKEFLDLAAFKPNTLGNTRMLRDLDPQPTLAVE